MDQYFHVTITFWRSEDGHNWSCTIHPYAPGEDNLENVRFVGMGDVTFADCHNISGTLRSVWTNMMITQAGVQLELF